MPLHGDAGLRLQRYLIQPLFKLVGLVRLFFPERDLHIESIAEIVSSALVTLKCTPVSSCPVPTHPTQVRPYPELRFIQRLKQVANSSRYTGGTLCSVSSGSFRALVSDPGLVNTTKYNVSLYAVFLSRR